MWTLKVKSESRMMPRLVTSDLTCGAKLPSLQITSILFVFGPTRKFSVFSPFNLRKLVCVHLFTLFVKPVIRWQRIWSSLGSNEIYSCVSLSDNITYRKHWQWQNRGPKQLPWGTPKDKSYFTDTWFPILTKTFSPICKSRTNLKLSQRGQPSSQGAQEEYSGQLYQRQSLHLIEQRPFLHQC